MTDSTEVRRPTILVVDDNEDNRELVAKVLANKGYVVVEAADGEEALRKVEADKPTLILMDISIPKIDGYEVTRRLKSSAEFRHIPVIALTAHVMRGDREKAFAAGCEGYIPKPVSVRDLPQQVGEYMEKFRRD
jgi:two-component system cell cycle response regulator DivK